MEKDNKLGENLKRLRKSRKLSQDEVANHLDIIRQTYSHYETGRIEPTIKSLRILSKLYGVSLDTLVCTSDVSLDGEGEDKDVYITDILINKVTNLRNLRIHIAEDELKHLVVIGKNGIGKTSLLETMADKLKEITKKESSDFTEEIEIGYNEFLNARLKNNINLQFHSEASYLKNYFQNGKFLIAYYKSDRKFDVLIPKHVEKMSFQTCYTVDEYPGSNLVQFLLDQKMTQALAISAKKMDKAGLVQKWFDQFEELLRIVFQNNKLELDFDEDTFRFNIVEPGKDIYDFSTLSSGYSAVLDIIVDIMMRMLNATGRTFQFDLPGIILIDELEAHLHVDMQKVIFGMLTKLFPKVQFIISTHSPYIIQNVSNKAVICDLDGMVK